MKKKDVINQIWNKVDLKKMDVEAVVNAMLEVIEESMIREENVNFSGFGNFEIRHRMSRKDPSKKVKGIHFEPSKVLKQKVNQ